MWVYGSPMQVHFHLSIVVHYNRPGYCMDWLCETGCMVGLYKTTTCGQYCKAPDTSSGAPGLRESGASILVCGLDDVKQACWRVTNI